MPRISSVTSRNLTNTHYDIVKYIKGQNTHLSDFQIIVWMADVAQAAEPWGGEVAVCLIYEPVTLNPGLVKRQHWGGGSLCNASTPLIHKLLGQIVEDEMGPRVSFRRQLTEKYSALVLSMNGPGILVNNLISRWLKFYCHFWGVLSALCKYSPLSKIIQGYIAEVTFWVRKNKSSLPERYIVQRPKLPYIHTNSY